MKKRVTKKNKLLLYCFCLSITYFLVIKVKVTHAWWNEQWKHRVKMTFNTAESGGDIQEQINNIPILIRLHSGNFDFTKAMEGGDDLRFIHSDDTTALKYHIEKFDSLEEYAAIWVQVPSISNDTESNYIWLYYGNDSAVSGENIQSTYDVNQIGIYHFDENEGLPKDSTAYGNHVTQMNAEIGLPSVIGNGAVMISQGAGMVIKESPSLNLADGFTFSVWFKIASPVEDSYIFYKGNRNNSVIIGIKGTSLYSVFTKNEMSVYLDKNSNISLNRWHHMTLTAQPRGEMVLYLDGVKTGCENLKMGLEAIRGNIIIGASPDNDKSFMGDLDELQLSNIARSAGWAKTMYESQGPGGNFCQFGAEQVQEGSFGAKMPIFYFRTIVKNISLDGWIINITIFILAVISFIVFMNKTFVLWLMDRENRVFLNDYSNINDIFSIQKNKNLFKNSTLFQIYNAGCNNLKKWIGNPYSKEETNKLSFKAMNSFKTVCEKTYIEENKKLNSWILVLSLAIAGGPFLGLLGTVWGVMNTFAAMAEIGEANIMAIAPGVASALSTTICGLLVAIPCLFAYNYLSSKIKNITVDTNIFIDLFVSRVDEIHGVE